MPMVSARNYGKRLHHSVELEVPTDRPLRVVVVSDTHSAVHPNTANVVRSLNPDHLLHGGDIGNLAVLDELAVLAPLIAVRGNIDELAPGVPDSVDITLRLGGRTLLKLILMHIAIYGAKLRAEAWRLAKEHNARMVVCGHSHVPFMGRDKGLVMFNPGSIGPRRGFLPITLGLLEVSPSGINLRHVSCETGETWRPWGSMQTPNVRRLRARTDVHLRATLGSLEPLVYDRSPSADEDISPYVRAASSVRRWGTKFVIISDDTNAIAVKDEQQVGAVLLPPGKGGRRTFGSELGNKKHKLDLEASVVLPDGRLVVFGSGSTHRRERIVVVSPEHDVRLFDGSEWYGLLRRTRAFSGSELNVEGVVIVGDKVRLFQRGNGAVVDGETPINATVDVVLSHFVAWLDGAAAIPELYNVTQYDLGTIEDVAWTFTDAALTSQGRVVFTATAEASEDTFNDGQVYGSCFGVIGATEVQLVEVTDRSGQRLALKIEGLEPTPGDPGAFAVVVDMDRPDEPALFGRLDVSGFAL